MLTVPAVTPQLVANNGRQALIAPIAEPERFACEPKVDGVRGLIVYDPTSGVLRSSSVDDIAAWFLDSNYDGDAFLVRHAYFTGGDDPYDKLRRALRSDISDEARATVNSTVSRAFPRPNHGQGRDQGRSTHYGDEVMKVFQTDSRVI